jgi:hypothetical protein
VATGGVATAGGVVGVALGNTVPLIVNTLVSCPTALEVTVIDFVKG